MLAGDLVELLAGDLVELLAGDLVELFFYGRFRMIWAPALGYLGSRLLLFGGTVAASIAIGNARRRLMEQLERTERDRQVRHAENEMRRTLQEGGGEVQAAVEMPPMWLRDP